MQLKKCQGLKKSKNLIGSDNQISFHYIVHKSFKKYRQITNQFATTLPHSHFPSLCMKEYSGVRGTIVYLCSFKPSVLGPDFFILLPHIIADG